MRVAQDAIPGTIIPLWFTPIKSGTYEVFCGQLCGLGHYSMKGIWLCRYAGGFSSLAEGNCGTLRHAEAHHRQSPSAWRTCQCPTPGTVAPPGAPKTADPSGQSHRLNPLPKIRPADKDASSTGSIFHARFGTCEHPPRRTDLIWLHRFAWLTAAATLYPDLQWRNGHEQRSGAGCARLANHLRLQHVPVPRFAMGRRDFL